MDFPGEPGICVGELRRPLVTSRVAAAASVPCSSLYFHGRAPFKTHTWVPLVRGTVCQLPGHVDA